MTQDDGLVGLLATLVRHRVDFVVVGGMAAVIGGVPVVTRDVDVLRETSEANATRLLGALREVGAVARGDPRKLEPGLAHLAGSGHLLLTTRFGPLDVLGTIEDATTYEDVLDETDVVDLGGFTVRVLRLERLLEVKRALRRPKDQLMALQIEATLAERAKRGG